MYLEEQVTEETVRSFAKEINAVYKQTSAKNAAGIDVIFVIIKLGFVCCYWK